MKSKNIIMAIFLVAIIVIVALVFNHYVLSKGNDDVNKIENATYYTDDRAQELFMKSGNYNFENLNSHDLYKIDDTLYIDFYFSKEATKKQLDDARVFALSTFVFKFLPPSEESPYMIFNTDERPTQWVRVTCRIYIDDKLNSEDKYDENGQLEMEDKN